MLGVSIPFMTAFLVRKRHGTIAARQDARRLQPSSPSTSISSCCCSATIGAVGHPVRFLCCSDAAGAAEWLPAAGHRTDDLRSAVVESVAGHWSWLLYLSTAPPGHASQLHLSVRRSSPSSTVRLADAAADSLPLHRAGHLATGDVRTVLWFAATLVLLLIAALLTEAALQPLKRWIAVVAPGRQALRGFSGLATATLSRHHLFHGAGRALLHLRHRAEPAPASCNPTCPMRPTSFFLDIQPISKRRSPPPLGIREPTMPAMPPRLMAVNGAVSRNPEPAGSPAMAVRAGGRRRRSPVAHGTRSPIVPRWPRGEMLVRGDSALWRCGDRQSCLGLAETAPMHGIDLGDDVSFNIQGVPLDATVTSIHRSRMPARYSPSSASSLRWIAGCAQRTDDPSPARAAPDEIAALQNRTVAAFPTSHVIDAVTSPRSPLSCKAHQQCRKRLAVLQHPGRAADRDQFECMRAGGVAWCARLTGGRQLRRWVASAVFTLEECTARPVQRVALAACAQVAAWAIMTYSSSWSTASCPDASVAMIAVTIAAVMLVGMVALDRDPAQPAINFLRLQTENE